MSEMIALEIGGSATPWKALGLTVVVADTVSAATAGPCTLVWPGNDSSGIERVHTVGGPNLVAGLPWGDGAGWSTMIECAALGAPSSIEERTVTGIDHVVVMTADLQSTCDAVTASLGLPVRRIREAPGVRQGFFRLGSTVLEVVEPSRGGPSEPALWGLVMNVADLDAVVSRVGDLLTPPKPAVQPGRRISTVRSIAGLGTAVALMTG